MKKIVLWLCISFSFGYSQNKQVLYDFANVPQKLMLNPGSEFDSKLHVGIPFTSQVSIHAGFTGFSTYDIFADDGVDINTKIRAALNNYGNNEIFELNEQLEVLSGGFKLKNENYLSFGYYQELDVLAKIPRDLVDLFYEGNSDLTRHYAVNKLALRAELLGVMHLGISKRINSKWQVGARAKIYSSVFNVKSNNASGSFFTEEGANNIYKQYLDNLDISLQTSGLILDDSLEFETSNVTKGLLLGGSIGIGFDVGFTHHLNKQWIISASLLDLGFIYNTKDVTSYTLKGNYEVEGLQLQFDPDNPEDYWTNVEDEFEEKVVLDSIYSNYVSLRPLKMYGAATYLFGVETDDCNYISNKKTYLNKAGFQLFSKLSLQHSNIAATLFYERRFLKKLNAKITYTIDSYSYSNIGVGFSTQIGPLNAYLITDNILNFTNLYNTKSISFQAGFNLLFNNKN